MKRFVLQEKRWDSRFDSKLLAGKAYADAADHYLPESISKIMPRSEKAALMIVSEQLNMHPRTILLEKGIWGSIKSMLGFGEKAAEQSDDPDAEAIEKEMQRLEKEWRGPWKRAKQAWGQGASGWQSAKSALGGFPQFYRAGQQVIPGSKNSAKVQAKLNVEFEKMKKELEGSLKSVWGKLGQQLKGLPKPDQGGFPNNPKPEDFFQVMYGTDNMEEAEQLLNKDQLGGIVGTMLATRDFLQTQIDSGIITVDQAENLMEVPKEVFSYYKGSLEDQYFTFENKRNDAELLHRNTMGSLMFEKFEAVPEVQAQAEESLKEVKPEEMKGELSEEEQKVLADLTPEQVKALATGRDSGIDTSILEKTQLEKTFKKLMIAAVIGIILGLIFLSPTLSGYASAMKPLKDSMIKKFTGRYTDDETVSWEEEFETGTFHDEVVSETLENNEVFEILSKDGLTQMTAHSEAFGNVGNDAISEMNYADWWGKLSGQFGSKEEFVKAFDGKMQDPSKAYDMLSQAATGEGKDLSVAKLFKKIGGGGKMDMPFSLLKKGVISVLKKKINYQTVADTATRTVTETIPGKKIYEYIGTGGAVFFGGTTLAAAGVVLVGAGVGVATVAALRKFKNSRQKQLQYAFDLTKKPFKSYAPPEMPEQQEKIGIPDPPNPKPEEQGKPIDSPDVAASLDLVKRALKKSGYPEKDIEPLLNSLWDGRSPDPKAPERLTTDSEQEMLRTSAWRKYSLMPLMTESPAIMLMEDNVSYEKFTSYMKNAAKDAETAKPNKKQIEQAAFAFNIANGIGDVDDLPDKYKKAENKKKLKKLKKRLKELEKEKDGMVKKKWKKKAKNRKAIIDDLEGTVDKFKGKYGKAKEKLGKALDDLEAGRIQMSEYLEQIEAMEQDRELTFNQTEQLRMDLEAQIDALTQAKDEESLRLSGEINKMADELKGFEGAITKDMQEELMEAIQDSMGQEVDPTLFFSNPMGYINTWMDNARGESDEKIADMESKLGELEPELDELRGKLEKLQKSGKNFEKKGKTYKLAKELTRILYGKNKFFSGATNAIPKKKKTYLKKFNDGEERLDKTLPAMEKIIKDFMNNKDFGKDKEVKINDNHSRKGDLLREQKEVAQTLTRWQKLAGLK